MVLGVTYILISWLTAGLPPGDQTPHQRSVPGDTDFVPLLMVRMLLGKPLFSNGTFRRRVAVVGANRDGRAMVDALMRYANAAYEVGCFDDFSHLNLQPPRMRTRTSGQCLNC